MVQKNSVEHRDSRYVQGGTTTTHPNRLGWWERRVFERDDSDEEYTIEEQYHNRPDLLAYDKYGSPHQQTFILQYNHILDMLEEFVTGKVILLPTPQRLALDITTLPTGGQPA